VITTPLPLPVGLVDAANCGFVVPFNDAQAAAQAVLKLDADPDLRVAMGASGHEYARESLGWQRDAVAFVTQLQQWATASR
jgi:glycosyltransferase involved in cell wall biosynthesis